MLVLVSRVVIIGGRATIAELINEFYDIVALVLDWLFPANITCASFGFLFFRALPVGEIGVFMVGRDVTDLYLH